jgi:HEAT repeat protein
MAEDERPEPLGRQESAHLVDFARACRAAARAVALYPPEHPAIRGSLDRLAGVWAQSPATDRWQFDITPGDVVLNGRKLARPDAGVAEFAELLHDHHIGQLAVRGGADADLWLKFLRLLATPPEEVRRQGGIARVWATTGGGPVEIREVDYAEVLKERESGDEASWDRILANCLQGDSIDLDDGVARLLKEMLGDPARLTDLARHLEDRTQQGGMARTPATALLAMLKGVLDHLAQAEPDQLDPAFDTLAVAASSFSPDVMMDLVAAGQQPDVAGGSGQLAGQILARLNDAHVVGFVAGSVVTARGATARLAEAFLALVPEPDRRQRVLGLAHDEVAKSPLGQDREFDQLWERVESLLGSYTDGQYVSTSYEQDLATVRARAVNLDAITDDPPERVAAWLSTVSDPSIRALDLQLLLDVLETETDVARWRDMANVVVSHVDDLLLVGEFAGAARLVTTLAAAAHDETVPTHQAAAAAIGRLIAGPALANIVPHLQTIDDEEFANAQTLALALGAGVIRPLAEMLAVQDRARVRQRLTHLLLAFGALGRQSAEQLKTSLNPSVRRVAVYLLREFGGSEALPDLASLLDDAEPHVQREAVQAILDIGTDEAYSVLERAISSGSARSRDAILHQLDKAAEDRAAPLFFFIVRRGGYRKGLQPAYLRAVGALGRLGGTEAVDTLRDGLYRGDWWAPFRTAALRAAAARALRQIGTPEAMDALRDAAERGPRGVRAAARPCLVEGRSRQAPKGQRGEP